MLYNDHAPPHFHAKYGEYEAAVEIESGEILEGKLPPRVLGMVQEWRQSHVTELERDWSLAQERRALEKIPPPE